MSDAQTDTFLTAAELSARWRGLVTTGTIENWRYAGKGPAFIKVGGKVVYRLSDVIEYENKNHTAPKNG